MNIAAQRNFPRQDSIILLLVLTWLWFVLINHLRIEWTLNPQYSYGWSVPFLCAYLVWRNFQSFEFKNFKPSLRFSLFIILPLFFLALLYAPTRLIAEANPDWRLVSWTLAIEITGITFCILRTALPISVFCFPLLFFLVAVPWPTFLEHTVIQGLTRADTAVTTELLGWTGIPAITHGNVIEIATGQVGIDEACSGIRSFQATLMISLFLGELYQLNLLWRLILFFAGVALAFLFNLVRMALLVWVAARKGISAIADWHDPAGVTILVACFLGLWGLGEWFNKKQKSKNKSQATVQMLDDKIPQNGFAISLFRFSIFSFSLALWFLLVEVSITVWYRSHEARLPVAQQWTIAWPTNQPAFKELSIPATARQILRFDEEHSAVWQQDGFQWQATFLRWNPGSAAQHLAQNHTPEICLAAAGHKLTVISELEWLDLSGLRMPFAIYEITDTPQPLFVFYCLWDDRAATQGFETASLTFGKRLAPVLAGLRNPGQRSLEIAVAGPSDADAAEIAARRELQRLIAPITK